MHEAADQIERTVRLPNLLPKISGGRTFPHRRIARAAIVTFVKRQELRCRAVEPRRHVNEIGIDREMRHTTAETEEPLLRRALCFVLPDGIEHVLPIKRVL